MSVKGITNHPANHYEYQADHSKKKGTRAPEDTASDSGVVYQCSKKRAPDSQTVANVKADNEARKAQLIEMVQKILKGQAKIFGNAKSKAYDSSLKPSQAAKSISSGGYWGADQTAQRILDFAVAYAGDDQKKLDEMKAAFEKGYQMAEKAWGGKLPDVCRQTYDAVMSGFDKLKGGGAEEETPSYLRDADRAARIKAALDEASTKARDSQLASFIRSLLDTHNRFLKQAESNNAALKAQAEKELGTGGSLNETSITRLVYDRVKTYLTGDADDNTKIDEMKAVIDEVFKESDELSGQKLIAYNDVMLALDSLKKEAA